MAKNKPRRVIVFIFFKFFSFFIFLFPIRVGLKIGQYLGRLVSHFLKKEQEIALNNLTSAFGDSKTLEEKKTIAKKLFENLGKNFVEIINLSKFNKSNIDKYISCKGIEIIEDFVRQGKGGIVVSAHFGNWELLAHYFAIKGFSVNVVARRVRMEKFENFLKKTRKRNKVNILYRDASAKDIVELLKKNEFVGVMPDQDMDSISGVFVDFFGKPAYTPNGPSVLNFLTGAPMVPCFIVRKDFGHEIIVEKTMELSKSGDRKKDILENTQRYTNVIEDYIRKFPSQWVWFHERWKTRPKS